jgi:hypothetical protein
VRFAAIASVLAIGLFVAALTGGLLLWLLVAIGKTNGYENLFILVAATFMATFVATLGMTKQPRMTAIVSALLTAIVVGGGFAVLYALFASICGSHPSSC